MSANCTICAELDTGIPPQEVASFGSRLEWLDSHWALAPSLGPVSPFHVLLLPRVHRNFSLASEDGVLAVAAFGRVLRDQDALDGDVVLFEHANSSTGCGVLHAHVHAVMATPGFEPSRVLGNGPARSIDALDDISREQRELAWCQDRSGALFAALGEPIASQTARRAVAQANKVTFDPNWQAYTHRPWFESSRRAVQDLAAVLRRSSWPPRPAA